jgi:hypothetical protein
MDESHFELAIPNLSLNMIFKKTTMTMEQHPGCRMKNFYTSTVNRLHRYSFNQLVAMIQD